MDRVEALSLQEHKLVSLLLFLRSKWILASGTNLSVHNWSGLELLFFHRFIVHKSDDRLVLRVHVLVIERVVRLRIVQWREIVAHIHLCCRLRWCLHSSRPLDLPAYLLRETFKNCLHVDERSLSEARLHLGFHFLKERPMQMLHLLTIGNVSLEFGISGVKLSVAQAIVLLVLLCENVSRSRVLLLHLRWLAHSHARVVASKHWLLLRGTHSLRILSILLLRRRIVVRPVHPRRHRHF